MAIEISYHGASRSFPDGPAQLSDSTDATGLILAGGDAGAGYAALADKPCWPFIAIELGTECLAQHTGLAADADNTRVVGFARFRMGDAEPGRLVELVRQPWTLPAAIDTARAAFEAAGLVTALCEDFPGRIVDRLIRPYLNAVLRRCDEKLASAADLDTTLRLGLGYPEGPLALLDRTGLHHHHAITQALYLALGDPDFAPPRRAQIAAARAMR